MALRAVVFDFDGTLAQTRIDFAAMRQRVIELAQKMGVRREQINQRLYVLELIDAIERKLPAARRAEFRSGAERIVLECEIAGCQQASPVPGASEALDLLRRAGLRLGVITRNCSAVVARLVQRFGWRFDAIVPREHARAVKPAAEHLLQALQLLSAAPAEAAMIGDHLTDIQCAVAAGALPIGVASSDEAADTLRRAGAHYVASSPLDAARWVLAFAARR